MFWNDGKDRSIQTPRNAREVSPACSGLKLSSALLDVPTVLGIVDCLNTRGEIAQGATFLHALDPKDLQSLLDIVNRYVLSDQKTLYALGVTFDAWKERGLLDPLLIQVGRVLGSGEWVAAVPMLLPVLMKDGAAQRDLFRALEIFSAQINRENVAELVDLLLSLTSARAFGELETRLKWDAPLECRPGRATSARCELLRHLEAILGYLQRESGGDLLARIEDGSLFSVLDNVLGSSPEGIRQGVPRLAAVMHALTENQAAILGDVSGLFHHFNREIICLKGTQRVPNGVKHVVRELVLLPTSDAASYIQRTGRATLQVMSGFCEYPPELATFYPGMVRLAERTAIFPAVDLMKAVFRSGQPLFDLMVDGLAGSKPLHPVLAALDDRQAWGDLLLVLSLMRVEDRARLRSGVQFLLQPRTELIGGRSIYAVLVSVFREVNPQALYSLVYGLSEFVGSDEPLLEPALHALRGALYVNDTQPVLGILRSVLRDATVHADALPALSRAAERPEFAPAIAMLARMAQDGRLKDLLSSVVDLFRQFGAGGKFAIHALSEPKWVAQRAHDWVVADLPVFADELVSPGSGQACLKLDPRVPFADTAHPQFDEQLDALLACVNEEKSHVGLEDAVRWMRRTRLDTGKTLFPTLVNAVKSLPFSNEQLKFVGDALTAESSASVLKELLRTGQQLLVARPLLDFVRPVVDRAWAEWKRLIAFAAQRLRDPLSFVAVDFGWDLWSGLVEKVTPAPLMTIDRGYLGRFVESKECVSRPVLIPVATPRREERVDEILFDYQNALTDCELVAGRMRSSYDLATFRDRLDPVLDQMAEPSASAPERHVVDAMLNVIRYFDLKPGERPTRTRHFERGYLLQWLHERSNDPQPITYFYPGEKTPRVRLVSSLDMLNLVLTEATRTPVGGENLGLMFLKKIAEAWGDEENTTWPEAIRRKFHGTPGSRYFPKTLRTAVNEMIQTLTFFEGVAGFPERPACPRTADIPADYEIPSGTGGLAGWIPDSLAIKASLHNIRQVMQVLIRNLPESGHPQAGGIRVLRNLFFELYYSTPEAYRCDDDSVGPEKTRCYAQVNLHRNNLDVILKLVELGLTRNTGRLLQGMDVHDPALRDFMETLIDGAKSPQLKRIAITLASPKRKGRELFWRGMSDVFSALDQADGSEVSRIKQLVFYLLAAPQMMARYLPQGPGHSAREVTDQFLAVIAEVLEGNSEYLAQRLTSGGLSQVLRSRELSLWLRALYESADVPGKSAVARVFESVIRYPELALDALHVLRALDEDPKAHTSWEQLSIRPTVPREVLRFMAGRSATPVGRETASSLRASLARGLESAEMDAIIRLVASRPDEVHRALAALGAYAREGGEIEKFVELARRALSELK